jgi:hypothetical protein
MRRLTAGWMLGLALAAMPAAAQRSAVSADLSPEIAGQVFSQTVSDVCIPAVAGNGVSALASARGGMLQPTQDAETRRQIGAQASETVWDVASARGVVTVREGQGRCIVSVYGPPVSATISGAMQALSGSGFEALVGTSSGARQTLLGASGGKRISVQLSGAEPGAPGHQSRFAVVTATVTAVQ